MKPFEELDCWKLSRELRINVSVLLDTFPNEEKFRLVDQMKRCSRSVTNNIAEGFGRFHEKDNARFCRNSKGSLLELKDHFIVAYDEGLINETVLEKFKTEIDRCIQVLNGYTNYLMRLSNKPK